MASPLETTSTVSVVRHPVEFPFGKGRPPEEELFRRTARRLRGAARWYVIGYTLAHLLSEFVRHGLQGQPFDFDVVYWVLAGSIALSALVDQLARPGRLSFPMLMRLGHAYEVVAALGIGLGVHANDAAPTSQVWGVSWICVWVVMYPFVLRSTPRLTTIASFAAACMEPLTILFWGSLAGRQMPAGSVIFAMVWPTFLCAVLASLGSRIIFRLRTQQERSKLLGTYFLEERIGAGGLGEVWRASHEMLARPAAVKLIRRDQVMGSAMRQNAVRRFEREAQATAWLTSPHTVALYDFGMTVDGDFYYAMEYLRGISLEDAVRTHGPFPSERATAILIQACHSLAEAHEKGMVHRDVKPANIFLCHAGVEFDFVKLLDFGLVKPTRYDITALTERHVVPGTPAYIAPEILRGREVDHRADIYGLGCVGYWMLTGTHVFPAKSALDQALRHVESPVEAPSTRTEMAVHPGLEEIILHCLEKSPAKRPLDCHELARRLYSLTLDAPWTPSRAESWWRSHLPAQSSQMLV